MREAELAALLDADDDDAPVGVLLLAAARLAAPAHFRELLHRRDYLMRLESYTAFCRADLLFPEESGWRAIYEGRRDSALLRLIRMNWPTFTHLCRYVDADWMAWRDGYVDATRWVARPGRPFNLDGPSCLALALAYLASGCDSRYLEMCFGCTRADVSRDLADGLDQLEAALLACPEAAIVWPPVQVMEEHAEYLSSERAYGRPPIEQCLPFALLDGLRLPMDNKASRAEQQNYYNGWKREECVENVILFSPDGVIIDAVIGLPGRFHDSAAAAPIVARVRDPALNPFRRCVLCDVGFASVANNDILASGNFQPIGIDVPPPVRRAFQRWQRPPRQAVEWLMRTLQATWTRIKQPLPTNDRKRNQILRLVIRLHNLVTRTLPPGHNQARRVYQLLAWHG